MAMSAHVRTTARVGLGRAGWLTRLAGFAGIVAILLQGALPIAHQARMAASDHSYSDYLVAFGDVAKVCGADERTTVGDRPTKPAPSHRIPVCPICLAAQSASSFLLPTGVIAPIPVEVAQTATTVAVTTVRLASVATGAQPRAPPQAI
jgi:hypothetical protein